MSALGWSRNMGQVGIMPVPAETLEQHGEIGEREYLVPCGAADIIRGCRGTYEAHVDDHWRG